MKVTSWNVEGRLSRFAKAGHRGSPERIMREIERLDSDVVFLPEAFDKSNPAEPRLLESLASLGYETLEVAYDEIGERDYAATHDPHLLLLSRLPIDSSNVIRLGDIRNAIIVHIIDPETGRHLRIAGIHLDDRNEKNRLRQVDTLLPVISASNIPTIMMGDFNAMHARAMPARILRNEATLTLINHLPHPRIKDILCRLSEMAIGETMGRILQGTNLVEADPNIRPTTTPKMRGQEWMPSIRMAQIDHILVSPEIKSTDFTIAKDGGSDHRALSVTITLD